MKKNLLFKILFAFSIILFFYTLYRSEIHWSGSKRDYYEKFYYLTIFYFLGFISIFLNKKFNTYFLIILITVSTSSILGDLYLSFFGNHGIYFKDKKIKLYKEISGKRYDERTVISIYSDLKKKDDNITVKISPKNFLNKKTKIFPLSGVSNKKTIYSNENGYYLIYKSDRYGFNNPDSEWDKNEIEYLLIGDSFAHGCCVKVNENIGYNLRNFSKKSVINLGYSANGPLLELASVKRILPKKS